jgi:hypothetical protein
MKSQIYKLVAHWRIGIFLPLVGIALLPACSIGFGGERPGDPVKNVRVIVEADSLVILYDLDAQGEEGWEIGVVLIRTGDPTYKRVPRNVRGDIGPLRGSRSNLRVVWDYAREMSAPPGDDFRVRLSYERLGSGSTWYWVGGGSLVVGGVVVYFLLKPKTVEDLPWPPSRQVQ